MTTRARTAALALVVVGVVVAVLLVRTGGDASATRCTPEPRVAATDVPAVFSQRDDDPRLARLVAAAGGWGLGRVVGEVGYDYGRWLSATALPAGRLGVWTKDDPVLGVLDGDLRTRWGIRQQSGEHAYDVAGGRFLQLRLDRDRPMAVSSYDLGDGRPLWCSRVGSAPTRYGDALGTAALPDGDVVVLGDAAGSRVTLTRLHGTDGARAWRRNLPAVGKGDYLGDLGDGHGVLGGSPTADLAEPEPDPDPRAATAATLRGFELADGSPTWSYGEAARVHVVGSQQGLVVVLRRDDRGLTLVALDSDGAPRWQRPAPGGSVDAALRSGVVVVRTGAALVGLDARTGHRLWRSPYPVAPGSPQLFPYGFELDAQPLLDERHLLLGTTAAVRVLDLRTGRSRAHRLPTDGINTTYWPYQLAVSGDLLAVVTNTGTVVLRRPSG